MSERVFQTSDDVIGSCRICPRKQRKNTQQPHEIWHVSEKQGERADSFSSRNCAISAALRVQLHLGKAVFLLFQVTNLVTEPRHLQHIQIEVNRPSISGVKTQQTDNEAAILCAVCARVLRKFLRTSLSPNAAAEATASKANPLADRVNTFPTGVCAAAGTLEVKV